MRGQGHDRHLDPAPAPLPTRGLAEIGSALRDETHAVVRAWAARLRTDPGTPHARDLREPELEDHAVTLLGDLAQALIIVNEAEERSVELLKDALEIQRTIADRHGRRRYSQRWVEEEVKREYELLREEIERVVRARIPGSPEATGEALLVIGRLLQRVDEISRTAWREASRRGGG